MKNTILLSESEKERILGLHKKAINESRLNEETKTPEYKMTVDELNKNGLLKLNTNLYSNQDGIYAYKNEKLTEKIYNNPFSIDEFVGSFQDIDDKRIKVISSEIYYYLPRNKSYYFKSGTNKYIIKTPGERLDRYKTYSIDHLIYLKVFVKDARLYANEDGIKSYNDIDLSTESEKYDKNKFIGYLQGNDDNVIKVSREDGTYVYLPRDNSYYIKSGDNKYIIETNKQQKTREKTREERQKTREGNMPVTPSIENQSKPTVVDYSSRIASVQTTLGLTTQSGKFDQETLNKLAEKLKS